jgi:uncharacterized membrane-anchored protein YjiN (DUF445 family)
MNDRITELMIEAGKTIPGDKHIDADFCEKFAELIVRECIGKVTKVSDSIKEFDSDNIDGIDLCDLITYHIKKHFGVEE